MTTFGAGAAFDMANFIATGSLAEFFDLGTPVSGTASQFIVDYTENGSTERLVLDGEFGDYVDGYPTTGYIFGLTYGIDGSTIITFTDALISVEDFTNFVTSDDLQGLFQTLLSGDDAVSGSSGADTLLGFDGNDVIESGSGDDHLEGGNGQDTLRGGLGSDALYGGAGDDFLSEASGDNGPFGNDIYDGGDGADRVSLFTAYGPGVTIDLRISTAQNTGSMGTDTFIGIEHITANYGDDTLTGNDSGNWFWTFNGTDTLRGNGGDDLFTTGIGTKILDGGSGSDTVEVSDTAFEPLYTDAGVAISLLKQGQVQAVGIGDWTLTSIENLTGFYGADRFTGDNNANILAGEGGNDTLIGNGGDDTLAGDGTFGLSNGDAGTITFIANADWLTGNDVLDGGAGNDTLLGGAGNDVLTGGAGADSSSGGTGSDIYMIASAADHTTAEIADNGAGEQDEVRFAATGTAQTLTLFAAETGIERIVIGTGTGATASTTGLLNHNVDASALLNAVTIIGNSGANTLKGTGFDDALSGGNGIDRLYGNAGGDTLDGGRDADVMYGGAGNDTYVVDHLSDAPIEAAGEGIDTVLASVAHTLKANVENLTLTGIYSVQATGNVLDNVIAGNSGANLLRGMDGADTLVGNAGYDTLDGGLGADTMSGGEGNDTYIVDNVGDVVNELVGEGTDTIRSSISFDMSDDLDTPQIELRANVENLELTGSADLVGGGNELNNVIKGNTGNNLLYGEGGNDKLYGGAGADDVQGGTGNDWLEGGAGRDVFTGGTGSDRFVFREGDFGGPTTANADSISDFSHAESDKIRLDLIDANTGLDGNQAFAFVGAGAFTGTAGELRAEQIDGNSFVQGDTNGDGVADFMIRVDGLQTLTGSDFIL